MPARHDQTNDPTVIAQLLQARRGTAFFSRKLNELTDAEMDAPSLLPGWTRRHIIAHVGYNARAIARLVQWAATGVESPMYATTEARNREIDYGATLSPIALRNLNQHAAIHLNVEWRDLPEEAWAREVRTAQGRTVPALETVWMRSREVWIHAVDLHNGAAFEDVPADVLERLLEDISSAWMTRKEDLALNLKVTDIDRTINLAGTETRNTIAVAGTLASITRWAAGRGNTGLTTEAASVPEAPRWI